MELLIALMVGMTVFLVIWSMASLYRQAVGEYVISEDRTAGGETVLRILRPYARAVGIVISHHVGRKESARKPDSPLPMLANLRNMIERSLISAGRPYDLHPYELMGFSVVASIVVCAGICVFGFSFGYNSLYVIAGAMFGGTIAFFFPFIWLRDAVKKRAAAIRKALPYALDLITLSVEAGMDFTTALARIVTRLRNEPLAEEFATTIREISMGKSRADALRDTAYRVNLPEMSSIASAIIQADELGAGLGTILRIQADHLRTRRFQRAEKLAMEAPVKMIFPLVAFIFPTTFIVIFGPIALEIFMK